VTAIAAMLFVGMVLFAAFLGGIIGYEIGSDARHKGVDRRKGERRKP